MTACIAAIDIKVLGICLAISGRTHLGARVANARVIQATGRAQWLGYAARRGEPAEEALGALNRAAMSRMSFGAVAQACAEIDRHEDFVSRQVTGEVGARYLCVSNACTFELRLT